MFYKKNNCNIILIEIIEYNCTSFKYETNYLYYFMKLKIENVRTKRVGKIFIFTFIGILTYFTSTTISFAQAQDEI